MAPERHIMDRAPQRPVAYLRNVAMTATAPPEPPAPASAAGPRLRTITGPSALGGDPRRFFHLAHTLAVTEFKLRFFGSALGYLWQLMRPLMLFGVLYVIFTELVRVGGAVAFYPVVLLMNVVLFTFFMDATTSAVTSVVDRESLVRKIQFPRMAIPASVVLRASFNLGLNLLVVLVFALASGVTPRLSWLQAVPLLLVLGVLTVGAAMLLSALYVRFRDVRPMWEVTAQILFYATPVIYTVDALGKGEQVEQLMMLNPLACILEQMRHAVVDPAAPTAADAAGGFAPLLIPAAVVVLVAGLGFWYFNREAPRIAEDL
jgi:ABC-2 type transport system permease protein